MTKRASEPGGDAQRHAWVQLLSMDGMSRREPVSTDVLRAGEDALGVALPPDLSALYLTSDGVRDESGDWDVIWSFEAVLRNNHDGWRRLGVPRTLLCFGDDGAGTWFCVGVDHPHQVCVWNFIDRQNYALAETLQQFWGGWLSGEIMT